MIASTSSRFHETSYVPYATFGCATYATFKSCVSYATLREIGCRLALTYCSAWVDTNVIESVHLTVVFDYHTELSPGHFETIATG